MSEIERRNRAIENRLAEELMKKFKATQEELAALRECVQAADEKDAAQKEYMKPEHTGGDDLSKAVAIRYAEAIAAYDAARAKVKL